MALTEQDKAAKTAKQEAGTVIGVLEIGLNKFDLMKSLHYMIAKYSETLTLERVRPAYRTLTKDTRDDVDWQKAKAVVLGAIQNGWYDFHKKTVPAGIVKEQERRLQEALMSSSETTKGGEKKAAKVKGPTVGALIKEELLKGTATPKILEHVKKKFPESKASEKDVAYYAYHLRKDGLLAKVERVKKAPKTASAKTKKASAKKPAKKAGAKKAATA